MADNSTNWMDDPTLKSLAAQLTPDPAQQQELVDNLAYIQDSRDKRIRDLWDRAKRARSRRLTAAQPDARDKPTT